MLNTQIGGGLQIITVTSGPDRTTHKESPFYSTHMALQNNVEVNVSVKPTDHCMHFIMLLQYLCRRDNSECISQKKGQCRKTI